MKKSSLLFLLMLVSVMTPDAVQAQDSEVIVGDISNTECADRARGASNYECQTIKLTRFEGGLYGELINCEVNCAYGKVNVICEEDGQKLSIFVDEGNGDIWADCICHINIYFTIYNALQEEYQLLFRGTDVGTVSFKEYSVVEIDLETLEQTYGDGSASVHSPLDMTSRIVNSRFDNNDVETGWSGTIFYNGYNGVWTPVGNAEIYGGKYNSFQKIDNLPKGIYAVGAKSCYIEGFDFQKAFDHYKANDEAAHYAKLYAEANGRQTETDICSVFDNQVTEPLECDGEKSVTDEETGRTYYIPYYNLSAAERYMHELNCYDNKVLAMVDSSLTIGVKKEKDINSDWSVFDDFTLFYYGDGADAYQAYLDEVLTRRVNTTVIKEGTLFTQYYLNELCKHRDASTEEEANEALVDIQNAYDNLQTNIELWKKWELEMYRGRTLASSPCYAESEQAKLLAQHCGAEATEIEAARSLTNEQLEEEMSKTEAMIEVLYELDGAPCKMLKEGKQWVYNHYRDSVLYNENGMPYDVIQVVTKDIYTLSGDTIIGGVLYYKMYCQEGDKEPRYDCALREEGQSVYCYNSDKDILLVEFNPIRFNELVGSEYLTEMVDSVDQVMVNDRLFIRHHYWEIMDPLIVHRVVEGVGSERNGIFGLHLKILLNGDLRYFEACYEDGKCIFTVGDFQKSGINTNIKSAIIKQRQVSNTLFDLQGRRLNAEPKHGVYIRNGKKVVK